MRAEVAFQDRRKRGERGTAGNGGQNGNEKVMVENLLCLDSSPSPAISSNKVFVDMLGCGILGSGGSVVKALGY